MVIYSIIFSFKHPPADDSLIFLWCSDKIYNLGRHKEWKILSAICYRTQVFWPSTPALLAYKIFFHPLKEISKESVDFKEQAHETVLKEWIISVPGILCIL